MLLARPRACIVCCSCTYRSSQLVAPLTFSADASSCGWRAGRPPSLPIRGGRVHSGSRRCSVSIPSHHDAPQVGAKDKERAQERQKFGLQILKGLGMWALTAATMRYVPQLLQSVDWGSLLLGAA